MARDLELLRRQLDYARTYAYWYGQRPMRDLSGVNEALDRADDALARKPGILSPYAHLKDAHRWGNIAQQRLLQVQDREPCDVPPQAYGVQCDAYCHQYPCTTPCYTDAEILWLGNHLCFDCFEFAVSNATQAGAYWLSPDDNLYKSHFVYQEIMDAVSADVDRIRTLRRTDSGSAVRFLDKWRRAWLQ